MKLNNFREKILRKYLKEKEKTIHVEAFVREDVWQKIKDLIGKDYVWFITTPANFDYCKCYFNLKMTKDEFRKILEKALVASQKRIVRNFSLTAKERYLIFRELYPTIEQRIPQYMIASYLGITKEFLSKIKSQLIFEQ